MKIINYVCIVITFLFIQSSYALSTNSPIGYWKTIDDVTGQPKSIVQIEESSNKTLSGKVVRLFRDPEKICTECTGSRKNQPILGMVIMEGLKQSNNINQWTQGEIVDPKNGKQYHCSLLVSEHGEKLQLRGFIGIPLFGRTQTWVRIKSQQIDS